jgi:hypothetical protein
LHPLWHNSVAFFIFSHNTVSDAAAFFLKLLVIQYVNDIRLPDDEDDFNFAERFNALKAELEKQMAEEELLNKAIMTSLSRLEPGVK